MERMGDLENLWEMRITGCNARLTPKRKWRPRSKSSSARSWRRCGT
jgi:hypothetical protein